MEPAALGSPASSVAPAGVPSFPQRVTDDLDRLLAVLPEAVQRGLSACGGCDQLLEVVLDLGRLPEARFSGRTVDLDQRPVGRDDLAAVINRLGPFGGDNRAGIERTLHRISAIRNRTGDVVGLTCRVGRAVFGTVAMVRDLLDTGQSLLLMGRPGVGKTTALREIARVLDVNLMGPWRLSRAAWPLLAASGDGRVLTLVSMSGKRVKGRLATYGVSKFALLALCQSMRNEGWEDGIRVTAICPSWVNTDMAAAVTAIPRQAMTQPHDLAASVSHLLCLPTAAVPFEFSVNCQLETCPP